MVHLTKNLALAAALAVLAAAPAQAFVGYGVEAGTPMYEALQRGYRPPLDGQRARPAAPRPAHWPAGTTRSKH